MKALLPIIFFASSVSACFPDAKALRGTKGASANDAAVAPQDASVGGFRLEDKSDGSDPRDVTDYLETVWTKDRYEIGSTFEFGEFKSEVSGVSDFTFSESTARSLAAQNTKDLFSKLEGVVAEYCKASASGKGVFQKFGRVQQTTAANNIATSNKYGVYSCGAKKIDLKVQESWCAALTGNKNSHHVSFGVDGTTDTRVAHYGRDLQGNPDFSISRKIGIGTSQQEMSSHNRMLRAYCYSARGSSFFTHDSHEMQIGFDQIYSSKYQGQVWITERETVIFYSCCTDPGVI